MKTIQTFQQWLKGQTERKDVVGDLAFTILEQDELPTYEKKRKGEHHLWTNWLVNHNASLELRRAFNKAWQEYQAILSQ